MSRKYAKRTASTKTKTYKDYLEMRRKLIAKGYELKNEMSKESFKAFYSRLQEAKKAGEIKSGAWQTLVEKEKYLSAKQAEALSMASKDAYGRKISAREIRGYSRQQVNELGQYLSEHKTEESLYGGDYE